MTVSCSKTTVCNQPSIPERSELPKVTLEDVVSDHESLAFAVHGMLGRLMMLETRVRLAEERLASAGSSGSVASAASFPRLPNPAAGQWIEGSGI